MRIWQYSTGHELILLLHREVSSRFDCVYLHPDVWEAATRAAGGTIDLVRAVISGEMKNGMALVRPPGHHALRDQVLAFFNHKNILMSSRLVATAISITSLWALVKLLRLG